MNLNQRPAAVGISLKDVVPGGQFLGASDIAVTSCSSDSRSCRPGDLFVAIIGSAADGHDHVEEALSRGAVAVLAERPLAIGDVPQCIVRDSREAFGVLCHSLMKNPSHRMPVIGVTGTNGKTTTTCLIASIFRAARQRAALAGTLGYCDGRRTRPATMTTPSAPVLAEWLARSESKGCTHAVLEVSSHALAQRRTSGIEFDAACVTNVRQDHLDFHGTLENYRDAKARLFSQLREGGVAILNLDDAVCRRYQHEFHGPTITYAMQADADVTAAVIERHPSEQTFLLTVGGDSLPVRTTIIGDHHVANCLAAAATALSYRIDLPTIVRGLEQLSEMPGRLQRIECGQPYAVFVDYAHTPDALETVLATLREVTAGRLVCVFGAGGQRDRDKRPKMGHAVEQRVDLAIVTDDNPRDEDPERIIDDILRGFDRPKDVLVIPDRTDAIRAALAGALPGDCVLVAGKGHETEQLIGRRRFDFDDREVARQWLYATTAHPQSSQVLRRAA